MNNSQLFFQSLSYLGFFAAIVLSWHFYLKARTKERLALIEKGVNVSEIYKKRDLPKIQFPWFKLGLLATGISLGLGFAILIIEYFPKSPREPLLIFSLLFFGGIAMILASTIRSRSERRNG